MGGWVVGLSHGGRGGGGGADLYPLPVASLACRAVRGLQWAMCYPYFPLVTRSCDVCAEAESPLSASFEVRCKWLAEVPLRMKVLYSYKVEEYARAPGRQSAVREFHLLRKVIPSSEFVSPLYKYFVATPDKVGPTAARCSHPGTSSTHAPALPRGCAGVLFLFLRTAVGTTPLAGGYRPTVTF